MQYHFQQEKLQYQIAPDHEFDRIFYLPINYPDHKEYYSYWPSKNSFAHPTGTLDNYSVTPDTSAIVINTNGIYYLAKLEVTNCCNTASYTSSTGNTVTLNSSTVVDISDFIYEETLAPSVSL